MNLHSKSALIVLGTLLLGMILGVLLSGTVHRLMMDSHDGKPGRGRLETMLERAVNPDESQKAGFLEVMARYSEKFMNQHEQHSAELKILVDSLVVELEPVLREDQIQTLKDRFHHMSRRFKRGEAPPKDL